MTLWISRFRYAPALLGVVVLTTACGDLVGATGDQGKLRFVLVTDFELPENDLRDSVIVAGHEQYIDISLTGKGHDEVDDATRIEYRVTPSETADTTAVEFEADDDDPADIQILVEEAGTYKIEAMLDGEVFDSIDLEFDRSNALELSVRVRTPWDEDFDTVPTGQNTDVEEGSQSTFLPIPLASDGGRLAGDIETEVTADPVELVVPGESIGGLYEDGYWTIKGAIDFYFIDPGEVTITIEDTVSGASGEHSFTVSPIGGD